MRAVLVGLTAVVLMLAAPVPGSAQDEVTPGTEGVPFLLLPVGAKAVSLGRAVTALDGPESVWWNPAGLASVTEGRVVLVRGEELAGEATAITGLLPRAGIGVVGLSYQLNDFGTQEYRDASGNVLGTVSFRYHVAVLSAATDLASPLLLGFNLKLIRQRVSCRGQCNAGVTATTPAFDAGLMARSVFGLPLRVGASLVHAGPRVQVINEEQSDPLPTRMRVGVAYDVLRHFVPHEDIHAFVTVELESRWSDLKNAVGDGEWPSSPATYIGAEVGAGVEQALVVRAGYAFGADLQVDGAGVGVALRYDRFELGIGKSLAQTGLIGETEPVHLTLGVVF